MSAAIDSNPPGQYYCPTCEKNYEVGDRCPADGTRLVRINVPVDPLLGRELDGRYMIVQKLGQGGMGAVYRGNQIGLGREVAIKVVSAHLVSEPDVVKRFLREAKLASRLSHPNAVAVLDFNQTEDGLFYLVMELVTGRTLDKVFEDEGALKPERVIRIAMQICDALEGAHALSIVHRDLKPSNVILLERGRDLVKVLDFGLAKSVAADAQTTTMTNAGALLGTPAFIPPELALGEQCDGRADLYSLGVVLYLLGSGRLPFVSDSAHELISMHATEVAPPMPGVPAPLAAVVDRMLQKDPALRYQTAAENREALEEALDRMRMRTPAAGTPFASSPSLEAIRVPAAPTPLPPELKRPGTPSALQLAHSDTMVHTSEVTLPKKRRWIPAAVATVLVLGVGGGYLAMKSGSNAGGATSGSAESAAPAPVVAPPAPESPADAALAVTPPTGSDAEAAATMPALGSAAKPATKKPPKNHHATTAPPPEIKDKTVPRDPPHEPVKPVEPAKPPDPTVPPF